jgi:DNA-binding MarR family transcriptional regulator
MTRLLDHLERMGYVTRERSTEDRRVVKVALTEEGRAVYPRIIQAGVDNLNRHLRGFSKQEAVQLEDFLRRILAND